MADSLALTAPAAAPRRRPAAPTAPRLPERPALASGVQLHGEFVGTGFAQSQWLVQVDGRYLQLTELLYRVLEHEEMQEEGIYVTVAGWGSFCTYLIDQYGMESFMRLYSESDGMVTPEPFSELFKEIYKEDFQVVDRAWRLWVLRYQPPAGGEPTE